MHNFYFENNGPIEKFLEISKDFPHNRCIEKPSKWIVLILCIYRKYSFLITKTLSNFWGGGGGGGGEGGGEGGRGGRGGISLLFENSIVLIKCTLYDTVFQR